MNIMTKAGLKKQYLSDIKTWKDLNPNVGTGARIRTRDKVVAAKLSNTALEIGETRTATAKRLGVSYSCLGRWVREMPKMAESVEATVTPVATARARRKSTAFSSMEIILPSGAKVTGIALVDAIELLKALA